MLPAGTADHFPLTPPETKELVKRIEGVLAMMPKKRRTALTRMFEKIGPPALLAFTAYMITAPRIQLTRELLAAQRQAAQRAQANPNAINTETRTPAIVASDGIATNIAASHNDDSNSGASANGRARFSALDIAHTDFKAL